MPAVRLNCGHMAGKRPISGVIVLKQTGSAGRKKVTVINKSKVLLKNYCGQRLKNKLFLYASFFKRG